MSEAISNLVLGGTFSVKCHDKNGNLKWEDDAKNAVTKAGLNDLLEQYFRGGANPTNLNIRDGWALGLIKNSNLSPNDTHSSHPGWVEFTTYKINGSTKIRPQWVPATPALQTLTAPLVDFDISLGGTISGVFLVGGSIDGALPTVADADRKGGTGAVPLLWSHALLNNGNQIVNSGDILRVTYTVSASSA